MTLKSRRKRRRQPEVWRRRSLPCTATRRCTCDARCASSSTSLSTTTASSRASLLLSSNLDLSLFFEFWERHNFFSLSLFTGCSQLRRRCLLPEGSPDAQVVLPTRRRDGCVAVRLGAGRLRRRVPQQPFHTSPAMLCCQPSCEREKGEKSPTLNKYATCLFIYVWCCIRPKMAPGVLLSKFLKKQAR